MTGASYLATQQRQKEAANKPSANGTVYCPDGILVSSWEQLCDQEQAHKSANYTLDIECGDSIYKSQVS
jgi:hypothetical protein